MEYLPIQKQNTHILYDSKSGTHTLTQMQSLIQYCIIKKKKDEEIMLRRKPEKMFIYKEYKEYLIE